jgi:hypothetical protein
MGWESRGEDRRGNRKSTAWGVCIGVCVNEREREEERERDTHTETERRAVCDVFTHYRSIYHLTTYHLSIIYSPTINIFKPTSPSPSLSLSVPAFSLKSGQIEGNVE